jgi:hypothetical protein
MNNRIFLIPLDSRPPNTRMPEQLAALGGFDLTHPPLEILGDLRRPADRPRVRAWLENHIGRGGGALIVSVDMLAYGGLVPSRKADTSPEEALMGLLFLRDLRARHPNLKIYTFNVILRDAGTVSDDKSFERWKREMKGASGESAAESPLRRRNYEINRAMIRWAGEGIFDYLILGKEDTAEGNPFGGEISKLKAEAKKSGGGRVSVQTGADELAMLLVARHVSGTVSPAPSVFIDAAEAELAAVPRYEPGPFGETLESQIKSAGGKIVKKADRADVVIMPYIRKKQSDLFLDQLNGRETPDPAPSGKWLSRVETHVAAGRAVGVADALHANGSSAALVEALVDRGLFFSLAAYAGWNTAANSAGTAAAQAIIAEVALRRKPAGVFPMNLYRGSALMNLLLERLVNDCLYSFFVRGELARAAGSPMSLSNPRETEHDLKFKITTKFRSFLWRHLKNKRVKVFGESGQDYAFTESSVIRDAYFPWGRLFEAVIEPWAGIKTMSFGAEGDG